MKYGALEETPCIRSNEEQQATIEFPEQVPTHLI